MPFRTFHVQADVTTFAWHVWVWIELPALFTWALQIAHATLKFLLTSAIARTFHAGVGLIAVRIVAALFTDPTNAVFGPCITLAVIVAMAVRITGRARVERSK